MVIKFCWQRCYTCIYRTIYSRKNAHFEKLEVIFLEITITLGQLVHFVLIMAGIILLILLSIVAANLITSVKRLNSILRDVNAITFVVADETKKIDDALCSLKDFALTANSVKEKSEIIKKSLDSITASLQAIKRVLPAKKDIK